MLIYTLRRRRKEIREIQIKYARTPLTCINEEGMSTVLTTKDLRLPCERGIKNAQLEMLITVAQTDSYLRERAYTHILCVGDIYSSHTGLCMLNYCMCLSAGEHKAHQCTKA